jgi:hypothetical protein
MQNQVAYHNVGQSVAEIAPMLAGVAGLVDSVVAAGVHDLRIGGVYNKASIKARA